MPYSNSHYWRGKERRAELAKELTEKIERERAAEMDGLAAMTKEYGPAPLGINIEQRDQPVRISVVDNDTVGAASVKDMQGCGNMALLNFASYKNPGGGFLHGSSAQEECLCHQSCLYSVLRRMEGFYEWNNEHKNRGLYTDRALWTPDVPFTYINRSFRCSVITCAAPNRHAAQEHMKVPDSENSKALRSRIRMVLDVAADNGAETLILGAYGCGVFAQDPHEVAGIFKEELEGAHRCFTEAVFAIPQGKDGNLNAFMKVLG